MNGPRMPPERPTAWDAYALLNQGFLCCRLGRFDQAAANASQAMKAVRESTGLDGLTRIRTRLEAEVEPGRGRFTRAGAIANKLLLAFCTVQSAAVVETRLIAGQAMALSGDPRHVEISAGEVVALARSLSQEPRLACGLLLRAAAAEGDAVRA